MYFNVYYLPFFFVMLETISARISNKKEEQIGKNVENGYKRRHVAETCSSA